MTKKTIMGIEELEKKVFDKNLRDEIVDRNIDFQEK